MDVQTGARILAVDRLRNSLVVTFDDGKAALYSAELLRNIMSQAKEVQCGDEKESEEAHP